MLNLLELFAEVNCLSVELCKLKPVATAIGSDFILPVWIKLIKK